MKEFTLYRDPFTDIIGYFWVSVWVSVSVSVSMKVAEEELSIRNIKIAFKSSVGTNDDSHEVWFKELSHVTSLFAFSFDL